VRERERRREELKIFCRKIMEGDKEDGEGGFDNPNPNPSQSKGSKGKSCKGCLYYSSLQKSKSKNPTCVGFSRALQGRTLNLQLVFPFFLLFVWCFLASGWLLIKWRKRKGNSEPFFFPVFDSIYKIRLMFAFGSKELRVSFHFSS
jgi:hypothetical protein